MSKQPRRIEFGDMWVDGETPSENHERWGNHWMAWLYWIFVLEDGARMVGEQSHHHVDRDGELVMPAVLAVRAMLLGDAIECSMKCYWVRHGNKMVKGGRFIGVPGAGADHNRVQLGKIVGFNATDREADVLLGCPSSSGSPAATQSRSDPKTWPLVTLTVWGSST